MKTQKSFYFFLAFMMALIAQPAAHAKSSRIRISAWYWLNSAPKNEWKRDFKKMHEVGFTDVVLCWGLDAAAFGTHVTATS